MLGSRLLPSTISCQVQAPPPSDSWASLPSSWSPASLCPVPNELSRPRTTPRSVWARAEEGHRASLHSQACLLGRWQVWGSGEALKGPQSGHCQPANPQRRHRGPQCPGAHPAPFTGTVPIHTGTGPSPWAGGRMSFYLLSSQLCQGQLSSRGGRDTEEEKD